MLECTFHKLCAVMLSNSIAYNSPGIQIDNGTDVVLDILTKKICNITNPYFIWPRYLKFRMRPISTAMLAFSILMLALKTSLKLSCRLLYRAICGVNLFILNNENIINIEKEATTAICKFYKVFSQDIAFDFAGGAMGSIILMDCDLPNDTHIHEFGMIIAETLNFASEFGETAKYSFVTVDSEMIHIHPLVKEILRVGLPMVKEAH